MYGYNHYGMGFGGLGMILFWLALIVLVILLVRLFINGREGPRQRTALDILEERYARGEIEREEYLQRRADLGG